MCTYIIVLEVLHYPLFFPRDKYDIALVELKRPLKKFSPAVRWGHSAYQKLHFTSNLLCHRPICIFSPRSKFKDVPRESSRKFDNKRYKAYVAGWGKTREDCQTGEWGPSPTKMCKFPFVYKVNQWLQ